MNSGPPKKVFQLPGPILSLTLIGILILSAVLYYRAVKIQRFLEPALAITTPRIEFSEAIRKLLVKEFGSNEMGGIKFTANSIFVQRSLLTTGIHKTNSEAAPLKKLSGVLLAVLKDPDLKEYVDLVLISLKLPIDPSGKIMGGEKKFQVHERAELILNSLFKVSPELDRNYNAFFAVTVVSGEFLKGEAEWVEFRFIPTERLHVEVLQSLKKYTH
jgi:hypothetical protein